MKMITALSAVAFLGLAAPAFADDVYNNGVVQKTAPGGMNNHLSPGDQRGLEGNTGGMTEGRAAATDAYGARVDSYGNRVNDQTAPGGMNNGLSPAIQHSN